MIGTPVHRRRLPAAVVAVVVALVVAAPASGSAVELAPPPQLGTDTVPPGWPTPPPVSAASYLLVEASTGQVLAARDPDQRRPVASTVKVLTALTVLARLEPEHEVTVPAAAASVGGASVGLDAGEVWTVEQLLDAVIARSGNDAATTLAIETAGSVEAFVALMREDAAALGIEGARLSDPSGLDDANRLSARDIAVITRAALRDPRFRELAGRATVSLPGLGGVASRNELLGTYPGATGVKTGFTEAAGYALVASAAREGRELVAVLLASRTAESRFEEAAALLDFGFGSLQVEPVSAETRLRVAGGWARLSSPRVPVAVPRDATSLTVPVPLPIEVPDDDGDGSVPVLWRDAELARLPVEVDRPVRADVAGGGVLGRALVDRAYAAMRAATTTGAWDASASLGDAGDRP